MTHVTDEPTATVWEQDCPTCAGSGQVAPAPRQQWLQARDQLLRRHEQAAGAIEATLLHDQLCHHATQEPPGPHAQPCQTCRGTGLIPTAVGNDLLRFLRRHGPRD